MFACKIPIKGGNSELVNVLKHTVSTAPGGMPEKAQPLRPPQPVRWPYAYSQVGESIRRERATDPSPTEEAGGDDQYPSFVCCPVAKPCLTLCDPKDCSPPGYPPLSPGARSNSRPSSHWCHPTISSSVVPFSSCPQSIPASGSFPMSQLFASGGQGTGASASASVLPVNVQFVMGLENTISCTRSERASQSISPMRSLHLREMTWKLQNSTSEMILLS